MKLREREREGIVNALMSRSKDYSVKSYTFMSTYSKIYLLKGTSADLSHSIRNVSWILALFNIDYEKLFGMLGAMKIASLAGTRGGSWRLSSFTPHKRPASRSSADQVEFCKSGRTCVYFLLQNTSAALFRRAPRRSDYFADSDSNLDSVLRATSR